MIEAIRNIGVKIGSEDPSTLMSNLTLDFPSEVKGKKQHLIILDFNLFDRRIGIDVEEIDADTLGKYLWIGTPEGARSPQIYFTTTTRNVGYLLSQTIPNLVAKLEKDRLKLLLKRALPNAFLDLSFSEHRQYLLDGLKMGLYRKDEGESYTQCQAALTEAKKISQLPMSKERKHKEKESFNKMLTLLVGKLLDYVHEETGLRKNEIGLFTLKIDGELMVDDEEYRTIVLKAKVDSLFGTDKKICSMCNQFKTVTDRPKFAKARSPLGYYITDKVGFSSGLSGSFHKNFVICKDCYKGFLVGEVFVRNRLGSRIGGFDLYIIPKFLVAEGFEGRDLEKWSTWIHHSFNSASTLKGLKRFEAEIRDHLDDYKEYEGIANNVILNLLFWRRGTGAETKVLKLIKDVPPWRLQFLVEEASRLKDKTDKLLGESNYWYMGLEGIYHLIPLRRTQNFLEYRKLLGLYDSIFSGKPISERFLIKQFVQLAQVYRFEKFSVYNINIGDQNPDVGLSYAMLKANLFLLYLQTLNLMKGGDAMDVVTLDVDDKTKVFIGEMGYDEARTALFLLGCLIGQVGNEQYRRGTSKPILRKIGFQGMSQEKIKRLVNEIFEKLGEYKRLNRNTEIIFADCKRLMDKYIGNWDPSDQDNVFYILSGYAYTTYTAIQAVKEKKTKQEN